jgi:hypothetical protein
MIDPDDKLTKVELERIIRAVRVVRDDVVERKLLLQERELRHGDGHVREAILICENDIFVLTSATAKLWHMLLSHVP